MGGEPGEPLRKGKGAQGVPASISPAPFCASISIMRLLYSPSLARCASSPGCNQFQIMTG